MTQQPPKRRDSATRRRKNKRKREILKIREAMVGRWTAAIQDASHIPRKHLNGRGHPCPKCGGKDRFAAFPDVAQRGSVHCRMCFNSTTDPRPGDGIDTMRWLLACDIAGACKWLREWLGWEDSDDPDDDPDDDNDALTPPPVSRSISIVIPTKRDNAIAVTAVLANLAFQPKWWDRLGHLLQLPVGELQRLQVGWSHEHQATTWPMTDSRGQIIGVRLRSMESGKKWSILGSSEGIFLPHDLPKHVEQLFIAEGPTDCAALLSLGFDCIGRPSCQGAVSITQKTVRRLRPSECVIVADADANGAGKRGAESLAAKLVRTCPKVRIIYPPGGHNDARDWVRSGATAEDVLQIVQASTAMSLTIKSEVAK